MSTLIEIRDLSKIYERGKQKVEVLHHINLDIAQGDFLALMGPSVLAKRRCLISSADWIRRLAAASASMVSGSIDSVPANWRVGVRPMSASCSSFTT